VNGPTEAARALVEASGRKATATMSMSLYRLSKVVAPRQVRGSMVEANEALLPRAEAFAAAFHSELALQGPSDFARAAVRARRFHLWLDEAGAAVASANWTGPTPNGARVNAVYTPPGLRGKGYASALVGALCQKLLDSGRRFGVLFADAANPTSNSIYRKLGFEFVAEHTTFRFD